MPINVQRQLDPAYAALMEYLAADQEARRRRQIEQAQYDAAQQQQLFATLPQQAPQQVAPPQQAPAGPQAAEQPAQLTPAQQVQALLQMQDMDLKRDIATQQSGDRRAAAFYGGGGYGQGRSDQAIASIINNIINGQQQSATQQSIAERQMQAAMAAEQRQVMGADIDLRNEAMSEKLPQWLEEGLAKGHYKYSRETEREIEDIQNTLARVGKAPNLTSEEKMQAQADLAQRLREARHEAQWVPEHQRPITPQQQFEQGTVAFTDQATGKTSSYFMGTRSGEPNPIPLGDKNEGKAELDRQKFEHAEKEHVRQWQEKDQDQQIAAAKNAIDIDRSFFDSELDMLNQRREAALEGVRAEKPDQSTYTTPNATTGKDQLNKAQFDAAVTEYSKKLQAIRDEFQPEYDALKTLYGAKGGASQNTQQSQPAADSPPQQGQQPVWETMPQSDVYITDLSSPSLPGNQWYVPSVNIVKRVEGGAIVSYAPVTSREEIAALDPKEKFILPDGRTGTRQ